MAIPVNLFECVEGGLRIDLGSFGFRMAQELLDHEQVGAPFKEMGGAGVS